jgi:hypothetical protein
LEDIHNNRCFGTWRGAGGNKKERTEHEHLASKMVTCLLQDKVIVNKLFNYMNCTVHPVSIKLNVTTCNNNWPSCCDNYVSAPHEPRHMLECLYQLMVVKAMNRIHPSKGTR